MDTPASLRFRWLLRLPPVHGKTLYLKLKKRKFNTEETYAIHQRQFFRTASKPSGSDKFQSLRKRIAAYAFRNGHQRALDVATGQGFQAKALKDAGFAKVTAIDLVPERLDCARKLFPEGIDFQEMDATRMSYPDKHFDCATVSVALHDMPSAVKRKAIAEIARVTKHTVVILEPRTFRNPILCFLYGTAGEILDESLNFRDYVKEDLEEVLREHGLEVIRDENVWWGLLNIKVCRPV